MRFRRWVGWWTLAVLLAFGGVAASYTNTWDETAPAGSALASTIDDHIRQLKLDMRERLAASAAAWNTGNITLAPTAVTAPALTVTGGTYTTDVNLASVTGTWSAAGVTFTGIKSNVTDTASASGSKLLDLQVGGSSKFSVDKSGNITSAGTFNLPTGMVAPFNLVSCPSGWSELTAARGRYVVGLPSGGTLAATQGTALTNTENRAVGQHNHGVSETPHSHTFEINNTPSGPQANWGTTASGVTGNPSTSAVATNLTINNAGSVAGTNAPYIQLLMCEKS